jgi:hypothetical protein
VDEKAYLAVRREAERRRGQPFPNEAWALLRDHYDELLTAAWVQDDDEFWKDLLSTAEPLCAAVQSKVRRASRRQGHPDKEEKIPAQLNAYEVERAEILSAYLADIAAEKDVVRRFRARNLGNRLLTPTRAWSLLRSPFAAHKPGMWFEVAKLPLIGHTYNVIERGRDERGPYSRVETVSESNGALTLKDRRPVETGSWIIDDRKNRQREFDDPLRHIESVGVDWKILPFPGEDGETHRTLVYRNSVLGDLVGKVQDLLRHFPWFEEDTVWFLLTGETPYVAPMTTRAKFSGFNNYGSYLDGGYKYGLIAFTIEPWVSAATVKGVYQDLQRQFLGKVNRPIEEKNRRLISFVHDKVGTLDLTAQDKRRLGRKLVAEWDRLHPEWSYGQDTRTFWRDFGLTMRSIALPDYKPFKAEDDKP